MSKGNVVQMVTELVKPITEQLNLELIDVEFLKEGSNWYLRVYIDKEGGVTIDDCENVSRKLDDIIDEKDPITQQYYLEVSSPGLDRPLKKESDFSRNIGKEVEIKLYKSRDNKKVFEGELVGLINNKIIIKDNIGETIEFEKQEVSIVKLIVKF